ncbi:MAG: radical SAM protein [Spirochaetota bacterium]
MSQEDLSWIYGFWSSLAPYAYSRLEDEVVILPPNLVFKTNTTGAQLLDFVGRGGRFEDIPGFEQGKAAEIGAFFRDLKAVYEGRPIFLDRVGYDFSFTSLPVLGEIAVTYRCNNRCRFCYAGCDDFTLCGDTTGTDEAGPSGKSIGSHGGRLSGLPAGYNGEELDTAGMKRIIDIFKDEAKIPFFSFTGGEPLIRQDIEELAAYACGRGLRVNLVTNGTLATPARAASLLASGISTAQVSLEAPMAELHDSLCGAPGAFGRSVAGIRAMLAAGISVQTNSTLTASNREVLLDLPDFVASLGVRRMSMNLFIPVGSGESASDLFFPYSETGVFIDEARRRARLAGVEFFWYSPIPICLYNPIARGLGNKSCAACDGLLSVSPSGDILPCSSWPQSIGNILCDGFSTLWFSDKARYFKDKDYAPDACKTCVSFTACQAACPLYWKAIGCAEIEGRSRPLTLTATQGGL